MIANNMKFLLNAPSTRLAIILVILCLVPISVAPGERPVGLLADSGMASSLPPYQEDLDPLPRNLTEEGLAALTVYMEAKGESFAGKLAVAARAVDGRRANPRPRSVDRRTQGRRG